MTGKTALGYVGAALSVAIAISCLIECNYTGALGWGLLTVEEVNLAHNNSKAK